MSDLSSTHEIKPVKVDGTNYSAAAGTTDLTSEAIDTAGYDNITLLIDFGAITSGAVTSIKVSQCDTSGGSYADLEGSAQTVADTDDDKVFVVNIDRPRERFLKTFIDRGTQNAVVDGVIAIMGSGRKQPVTQGAMVGGPERFSSPAEGTA